MNSTGGMFPVCTRNPIYPIHPIYWRVAIVKKVFSRMKSNCRWSLLFTTTPRGAGVFLNCFEPLRKQPLQLQNWGPQNHMPHCCEFRVFKYSRFSAWSFFTLSKIHKTTIFQRSNIDHMWTTDLEAQPAGPWAGSGPARRLWVKGPHMDDCLCSKDAQL